MKNALVLVPLALALLGGCPRGDGDDDDDDVPGPFGSETTIVALVNPVINEGSSTDVEPGPQREGVTVRILDTVPEIIATTNEEGIAVLGGAPVGANVLDFGEGTFAVDVIEQGEIYDVVVAVDDGRVEEIVPTVRYPIGGDVVFVAEGGDIDAAIEDDNAIVVLGAGGFTGNFEVRAEGVLLFGAPTFLDGDGSVIDGDVAWLGGDGRMRGVTVTGTLTTNANGFSAAFSDLGSAQVTGNGVSLIKNTFSGDATVPSTDAVLVDNSGIP